jgi:hypothetical protein
MAVTDREQLITVLNRAASSADRATVINSVVEWMNYSFYADIAEAFINALNATSTVLTGTLNPTLVAASKDRKFQGRTKTNQN